MTLFFFPPIRLPLHSSGSPRSRSPLHSGGSPWRVLVSASMFRISHPTGVYAGYVMIPEQKSADFVFSLFISGHLFSIFPFSRPTYPPPPPISLPVTRRRRAESLDGRSNACWASGPATHSLCICFSCATYVGTGIIRACPRFKDLQMSPLCPGSIRLTGLCVCTYYVCR